MPTPFTPENQYPLNPVDMHIVAADLADDRDRLLRYKAAWEMYEGRHPDSLKIKRGAPNVNTQLNFSELIVDKGVQFLFGQDVDLTTDEDAEEDTPEEEYLDNVLVANRGLTLLQNIATNGAICGNPFVRIQLNSRLTLPYPRLINLDPAYVTPLWEADDIDDVFAYRVEYPAIDRRTGKPITLRTDTWREDSGVWVIRDYQAGASGRFELLVDQPEWNYPFAPIVHCQNLPSPNAFWGKSDLEDPIIHLNRALNFVFSNLLQIVYIHAHPKLWAKGVGGSQVDVSADGMIKLASTDAMMGMLQAQGIEVSSLAVYDKLKEALHEIAHMPEVATGKLESTGPLSGVALSILYGPIVERTNRKRQTYGEMLVDLARRLLAIGGFGDYQKAPRPAINWPEITPQDPLAERQALQIDAQLGVSDQTILEKLGYDAETETKQSDAETKRKQALMPAMPGVPNGNQATNAPGTPGAQAGQK